MILRPGPTEKGGSDAAFFLFFLFAVSVLWFGGSHQYPLALIRAAGFLAAAMFLARWKDGGAASVSPYPLLVGGFVLLSLGHAPSSVYPWVSLQHGLNVALASVILWWAFLVFRRGSGDWWPVLFWTIVGLAAVETVLALVQKGMLGQSRPHGSFDNPNFLSEFLVAASLLLCARALGGNDSRGSRAGWFVGAAVFLWAGLSATTSRGVLVAWFPAAAFLLIWRFGWKRGGAALVLGAIPLLAALGGKSIFRFGGEDVYHYGRVIIWKSALRTFAENPLGVGLGGFKYYWFSMQEPVVDAFRKYGKFAHTAHNEYLEVLAGLGILGAVLFLCILVFPLVLAARHRKRLEAGPGWRAAGAVAVLLLSGAHALFDSNFHEMGIVFLDAILLGFLLAGMPEDSAPVLRIPRWAVRSGAGICLIALFLSAATLLAVVAYGQGETRMRKGDAGGAERAFRLAVRADPLRAVYPDALSALYHSGKTRDLDRSIEWQRRARSRNPREPKYAVRLSFLLVERYRKAPRREDLEEALRLPEEALEINPYGVETLWYRAELREWLGLPQGAVEDLLRAVRIEPNFCRGYDRLSRLTGGKDPEMAQRWATRAEECRARAAGPARELHEQWLVGDPEGK